MKLKINKTNFNGGYIGLVALLICVAVIALIVVRTDLFTGNKDGKSIIEQGNDAIDKANEIKNKIEGENLEGEADPNVMKLDMKTWNWISALYNDDRELKPKTPGKFALTFGKDGAFTAKTDCNNVGGNYVAKDGQITFSNMRMTLMFCEGSQEGDFVKLLENTSSYFFTSRGELILELKFDSGTATFR